MSSKSVKASPKSSSSSSKSRSSSRSRSSQAQAQASSRSLSSKRSISRQSPSRASSAKSPAKSAVKSSSNMLMMMDNENNNTAYTKNVSILMCIVSIIMHCLIIYYLINLENIDCNCISDWRHNYIKYFSVFIICLNIACCFIHTVIKSKTFIIIFFILHIINFYAFFTYIRDLNLTQCVCAVDKQPNLNSFMDFLRWAELIIYILAILYPIILACIVYASYKK